MSLGSRWHSGVCLVGFVVLLLIDEELRKCQGETDDFSREGCGG